MPFGEFSEVVMIRKLNPMFVICGAVVIGLLSIWFAFSPNLITTRADSWLFEYVGITLALLPIYGLWLLGKRLPRWRLGFVALACGVILSGFLVFIHYMLGIEGEWVKLLLDVSRFMFVLSGVVVLWQATRVHNGNSGRA